MASIRDPNDTSGRLIAADKVEGTSIYNRAGENLGCVEDVMIDKVSGRIAYAVVAFGGFLGIGDRHYPLPWQTLKYDTNMGGFVVDLDKQTLEGAPSYTDADTVGWRTPPGASVYTTITARVPTGTCRNGIGAAACGPPFVCQANVAKISSSALS
jgi:sporulation protein YlmC with PRC-barrel domain